MRLETLAAVAAFAATGCASGGATAVANRTFYQDEANAPTPGAKRVETPYPPLDGRGGFVGVSLLDDTVRLSRPRGWHVRRASLARDARFVQYVSPEGYSFAIYERRDSPHATWAEIRASYEAGAATHGNEVVAKDIPIAIHGTQGRKFVLRRSVKGQREAYVNASWETLLRGRERVELVQVVREEDAAATFDEDLLRVVASLELL